MEGINIIVAISRNSCIGKDNSLPWRQRSDMKFFKEKTTGNAVIMGRKTFESMGNKPLPNRLNIVVSTYLPDRVEGIVVVRTMEDAIRVCEEHDFKPFIIGGGSIFEQSMDIVDNIYLTVIDTEIEDGGVFFPEFNYREWHQDVIATGKADEKNDHDFTIYKMVRK